MQALQYAQAQHDNNFLHSTADQAKMLHQAKQQLLLNPHSPSPNLTTPSERALEPNPTGLRPGLGFALASDSTTAVASPDTKALKLSPLSGAATASAAAEAHVQSHKVQQEIAVAELQRIGKASTAGAVAAVRQFAGSLYVSGPKGEELICELKTDLWPAHLARWVLHAFNQRSIYAYGS